MTFENFRCRSRGPPRRPACAASSARKAV